MSEVYMNIRRYCYTTSNSQTRVYSEVDTENLGLRVYARHLNRPERPKIILVENLTWRGIQPNRRTSLRTHIQHRALQAEDHLAPPCASLLPRAAQAHSTRRIICSRFDAVRRVSVQVFNTRPNICWQRTSRSFLSVGSLYICLGDWMSFFAAQQEIYLLYVGLVHFLNVRVEGITSGDR